MQLLGRIRGNGDTRAENTSGFPSESGAPPSGKYVLHHCQRGNLISESTLASVDASLSLFTRGYPAPLCRSFLTPFILVIFYCMCIYRRIYRVSIYSWIYIYNIGNSLRFLKINRKMSVEIYLKTLHGIKCKVWRKLWRSGQYLLWWRKGLFISKWSFLIKRNKLNFQISTRYSLKFYYYRYY